MCTLSLRVSLRHRSTSSLWETIKRYTLSIAYGLWRNLWAQVNVRYRAYVAELTRSSGTGKFFSKLTSSSILAQLSRQVKFSCFLNIDHPTLWYLCWLQKLSRTTYELLYFAPLVCSVRVRWAWVIVQLFVKIVLPKYKSLPFTLAKRTPRPQDNNEGNLIN